MTAEKPTYVLLGNMKDSITTLMKKGTPNTLLIRTKKVPAKGETVDPAHENVDQVTDIQVQRSMLKALVEGSHDLVLIDRDNITPKDFDTYSYVAKIKPCPLETLEIKLDSIIDYTQKSKRNIIIIEGDNPNELINSLKKSDPDPVIISLETLAVHAKKMVTEKPDIDFTPSDLWDTFFINAVSDTKVALIIATRSMISDDDYTDVVQRFSHSYKCNLFIIKMISEKKEVQHAIKNGRSREKPAQQKKSGDARKLNIPILTEAWWKDFPKGPWWANKGCQLKEWYNKKPVQKEKKQVVNPEIKKEEVKVLEEKITS